MSRPVCHPRDARTPRSHWLAALGMALVAAGCGGLGLSAELSASGAPAPNGSDRLGGGDASNGGGEFDGGVGGEDAGRTAVKPSNYLGSPLCQVTAMSPCTPDQGGLANDYTCVAEIDAGPGANGGPDASATSVDAGAGATFACHVEPDGDGGVGPTCTASGTGTDGAPCRHGTDCAPDFECIGAGASAGGDGVCRHYCCNDTCTSPGVPGPDDGGLTNTHGPFCDIEPVYGQAYLVPVCVDRPPCQLFQDCPNSNQTCTIVDDTGRTACVDIGPGLAGQDCEQQHCGSQLACWGPFPMRQCAQLCRPSYGPMDCGPGEACITNSANFPAGVDVGVCQPSP